MRPAVAGLNVTPYERRHRQAIDELLFHTSQVHTHLDWQETDHWLDSYEGPMRLAWEDDRLIGLLAASQPLNYACWLRLAALAPMTPAEHVLPLLWYDLTDDLRQQNVSLVALLITRDWFAAIAPRLGFQFTEDVVTLRRSGKQLPESDAHTLTIRLAYAQDVEMLTQLDQEAFAPPWQLTQAEMRQAVRVASICTLAQINMRIVGYQLSTLYYDGAHLARLGVMPELQGQGIGSALLSDVLQRFFRRGIHTMTVNTQASNERSLRLYRTFGFRPNGYSLPVWMAHL